MSRYLLLSLLTGTAALGVGQELPRIETDVTGGWSNWAIGGNGHKFRQYATPPEGLFLRKLSLSGNFGAANDARFVAKAPGQDDYRLTGQVRLNGGTTRLIASDARNAFFDPSPADLDPSRRRMTEVFAWQKLGENFAISFRNRVDRLDKNFEPGFDPLRQRTTISNVAARGSLWHKGFVELSFTDSRYADLTGVLPDTKLQRMSAGVMQQFGDNLALSGSYARSFIRQSGVTNKIDEWNFGGNLLLGHNTNLLLDYRNERLTLPSVLIAYDRSRQMARGRLVHRLGNGWTSQLAYTQLALERLWNDHSFVDVPRFHTFDLQVSGRLSRTARLSAKLSRQTLQGAAEMQIPDTRALYWTSRWYAQVKFNARNSIANLYAVFDWHQNRNAVREVTVERQGLLVGAEWELKPELELYAEISNNLWSGRTSDPLSPDLNDFFPDAVTFTSGMNWTVNARTWLTANYTFFNSEDANTTGAADTSVWGGFFTGSLRYRAGKDTEFGITLAPWHFVDTTIGSTGYSTGLIQVNGRVRF
jgi:hypothetical protein